MRILHLADYGGPYPGSFIPMLRAAAAAAERRGWSCELAFTPIAADRPWLRALREDGLRAHIVEPPGAGWLRDWLEAGEESVLHTHFSSWDLPALAAAGDRAAVFWHLHTRLHAGLRMRARNSVKFAWYGRRVERILCVGPDIRDKALARLAPRERTLLFPNAIDVAAFPPLTGGERTAARERLGLPRDAAVLVLFGWDWRTKGGDLFLAAAAELRRRGRAVVAVPVGGEAHARADAARLGIGDAVVPLAPMDDVPALYGAADVFVAASRDEGLGFAVLEAICSGTPAVVSDVPGHRWFGRHLDACALTPLSPAAFADAIAAELDADPGERARRLAASRAYLEQHAGLAAWAERLCDLYASVER